MNNTIPTLFTSDLFREMDRFFNDLDFFNIAERRQNLSGHPKGDIVVNKEGNLVVELALAGYSKDQLVVNVEDNKLIVSASKSSEDNEKSSLARRAFKKVFTDFAHTWDINSADVSYKDGLLKIIVPPVGPKTLASKNLEIR